MFLTTPFEELMAKVPRNIAWAHCVDELIKKPLTHAQVSKLGDPYQCALAGTTWCKDLVIGDCQHDVSSNASQFIPQGEFADQELSQTSTLSFSLLPRKEGIARTFAESIGNTFASRSSDASAILQAYGITPSDDDDRAFKQVLKFATDICFLAPVISLARSWPGNAYAYFFNEPNPWPGPLRGQASHILDVALLFMNFEATLNTEQAAFAKGFAEKFIRIVSDIEPWPRFTKEEPSAMVFGGSGEHQGGSTHVSHISEIGTGRRQTIFQLVETVGLDSLIDAWNAFRG